MSTETVTAPPPAPAPEPRRGLRHIPALDGLRGYGLCAVLLFHGGYSWIPGGYLSVSMFFTLSGFLITSLMLDDFDRIGRLDIKRFWMRRARRLLPAAIATLLMVLALRDQFGAIAPSRFRGDILAALLYSQNWWLIYTEQSYGAIFAAESPVQHFWSLAIEEQYYVIFPIIILAAFRWLKRPGRVAVMVGAMALASFVAGWIIVGDDATRAYFGTDTRAFDILAGVLLGFALNGYRKGDRSRVDRRLETVGVLAFGVMTWLWLQLSLDSWFVFRGGIALNAACTALIITAGLQRGVVTRFLDLRVFRFLGGISYGVYLLHWPIFLWLDPERLGLDLLPTFIVRVGVTLAAALAMYYLFEHPIRMGKMFSNRTFMIVTAVGIAAVVVGTLMVPGHSAKGGIDMAETGALDNQVAELKALPRTGQQRVLVIGDSFSWTVESGLARWGAGNDVQVAHYIALGCGTGGAGTLRYLNIERETFPGCETWHESLPAAIDAYRPDTVLVVFGLADISARRFPDGKFRAIGNPRYDAFLARRIRAMTEVLQTHGAEVVWAVFPHIAIEYVSGQTGQPPFPENDPERMDKLNALVAETLEPIPNTRMVDIAGYGRRRPGGEFDPDYRPDGAHLTDESSDELATWLGPKLRRGE